jgi:hypothetical protein
LRDQRDQEATVAQGTSRTDEIGTADALALRMSSLLLAGDPSADPTNGATADVAGVVTWFGAMQAQDLASGLWSFGSRRPTFDLAAVNAALERREALRTWPMRGTVHFVPARDAHWMLDLMGAKTLAGAARRREFLGLDADEADRAVDVLGEALSGGQRLTRAQCIAALHDAGVDASGQLGYHLLWYASQRGVTCIAPNIGNEQTFVLLDEWVPEPHRLGRDEALATITLRYFQSHGPASRKDFAGWTGLSMAEVKQGLALVADLIVRVDVDGAEMYVARQLLEGFSSGQTQDSRDVWWALPGFDEYLLGFKERSLMLEPEHLNAVIPGGNGVFQSTLVQQGRVVATWKRTRRTTKTVVDVSPLTRTTAAKRREAAVALDAYGRFVGQPLEIRWP